VSQDRHLQCGAHNVEEFAVEWGPGDVAENVGLLLDVFGGGMFLSPHLLSHSMSSFSVPIVY